MTNTAHVEVLIVGRGPGADITVADQYASPQHCRIARIDGTVYVVEDLGSTNGTRVRRAGREIKVTSPVVLEPGDAVIVGRTAIPWGTQ